jgi:hypothetical protein
MQLVFPKLAQVGAGNDFLKAAPRIRLVSMSRRQELRLRERAPD